MSDSLTALCAADPACRMDFQVLEAAPVFDDLLDAIVSGQFVADDVLSTASQITPLGRATRNCSPQARPSHGTRLRRSRARPAGSRPDNRVWNGIPRFTLVAPQWRPGHTLARSTVASGDLPRAQQQPDLPELAIGKPRRGSRVERRYLRTSACVAQLPNGHSLLRPRRSLCIAERRGKASSVSLYVSSDLGTTWSVLPMPTGFLPTSPLSCSSARVCAVGGTNGGQPAFAVTIDGGHQWGVVPMAGGRVLRDVICPTSLLCVGVAARTGLDMPSSGNELIRIDRWRNHVDALTSTGLRNAPVRFLPFRSRVRRHRLFGAAPGDYSVGVRTHLK